ncbi:MAG: ParB/RepB/Spo0J family partition protein [Proteobacteria bacterium]|nr:ParB/RepB/Spo0J family partition protein [Candidatus Enterousia scatequi]
MSKFGLGRGLEEITAEMGTIPDISILTGAERVVVKQIPLSQIGINTDQPRKVFDNDKLAELAESIREKGVLQPILLRSVKNKPYLYEIVAGERRYRASKMAGLAEVPALVKDLNDATSMEIALIENVQRENLNPIEEALGYQNLIDKCDYTIEDVARLIGKSVSFIRNSIRLIGLPDSVKSLVSAGNLSASHARTLLGADNPEKMAQEIINGKLSVADTQKKVKISGKNGKKAGSELGADVVKRIELEIKKALDVPVKLVEHRGGAGQIVLSFATRPQLYDLVDKLTK